MKLTTRSVTICYNLASKKILACKNATANYGTFELSGFSGAFIGAFKMSYQIHTTIDAAAMSAQPNERTIVCRFKNPARTIAVNIPSDAWTQMEGAVSSPTYRALLGDVLEAAAKSIISAYYTNTYDAHRVTVSSIPPAILTPAAILEAAAGNNSEWLTKDELAEAWKTSATRAVVYDAGKYAASQAYRRAYTRFEEMILKLAGKTSSYKPDELDVILAKLNEGDFETDFGRFVLKRVKTLQERPQTSDVDMSVL